MITRRPASVHSRLLTSAAAFAFVITSCGGSSSGAKSAESWCDFAKEATVVDEVFSTLGDDPAEMETGMNKVEELIKRLPGEAPAEIADDAKVIADGTQMLIDAFAAADYNLLDTDLTFMGDSDLEARLETAGDNIDAYTVRECGQPFGESSDNGDTVSGDSIDSSDTSDTVSGDTGDTVSGDSSDGDFDPNDGTLREQLVTQFESLGLTTEEAGCIADNLDFTDPTVQSGDVGAMLQVFGDCGISMDRIAELGAG